LNQAVSPFVSTLMTLLAIINPVAAMPVFLRLLEG
jgi:small neutral amino acid transporter SnatA (MarC family)